MCHFKCERSRCFYMLLRLYMLSCAFCLCFYTFIHLYMLPYAFLRFFYAFSKLSYAFLCFSYAFLPFHTLLHAFTCFYMLYLDKVSEQQEKLPLCLTGFYLRKPVKSHMHMIVHISKDTTEYKIM